VGDKAKQQIECDDDRQAKEAKQNQVVQADELNDNDIMSDEVC